MENRYIKISEAAQMMGVTSQTVRNWCARGLLAHRNIRGSGGSIDLKSLQKYAGQLRSVSKIEESIEAYKSKLKMREALLKTRLEELTGELQERQLLPKYMQALSTQIIAYLRMIRGQAIKDDEAAVLISILKGKSYEDIARMTGTTRESVRLVAQRAIRQLYRMPLYAELLHEANALRNENNRLNRSLRSVLEKVGQYEAISEQQAKQLGTLVRELPLSVRVQNCLHAMGIKTVDDLCQLSPYDLINQRNFGRKCLWEVEDALKSIGMRLKSYE